VEKSYAFGRDVWDILLQCDIGFFVLFNSHLESMLCTLFQVQFRCLA
jgi:hypothetical protein